MIIMLQMPNRHKVKTPHSRQQADMPQNTVNIDLFYICMSMDNLNFKHQFRFIFPIPSNIIFTLHAIHFLYSHYWSMKKSSGLQHALVLEDISKARILIINTLFWTWLLAILVSLYIRIFLLKSYQLNTFYCNL